MGTTFGIVNPSPSSYTTRTTQLILWWQSIVNKISFRKPRFIVRLQTRQYGIYLLCRGFACTHTIWVLRWKAGSWFRVTNIAILISSFVILPSGSTEHHHFPGNLFSLHYQKRHTSAVVCLLFLNSFLYW